MKIMIIAILSLLCLCGCSGSKESAGVIDWHKEISAYEQKGWKYKEMFGTPGMAGVVGNAQSETARSVTGYWVENGQRHEKDYKQETEMFCLLAFGKSNGDSFLVVLSRGKTSVDSK